MQLVYRYGEAERAAAEGARRAAEAEKEAAAEARVAAGLCTLNQVDT
jgi:hypothetical protein